MSFAAASAYSDWVEIPDMGIKVNITSGHVLNSETGKLIPMYRGQGSGVITAQVPKNEFKPRKGFGKGRLHQLGRIILFAVNEGTPFKNPRMGIAIPVDGNKWNIRPQNLQWISRKELKERHVVEGNFPLKLDVHRALTVKDVVNRLELEHGIVDRDAVGYSFGLSANSISRLMRGTSWGFAKDYVKETTVKAADYQIAKAREAVALFADYDEGLSEYWWDFEAPSTVAQA